MTTKAQELEQAFRTVFPHLTAQAVSRLAHENVRVVDMSTEQGLDLAVATLLVKGARRTPIGTTLQNLRVRARLTQEEVTRQTVRLTRREAWHGSKLTRIESGRVPISFGDLRFLLHLYGVRDQSTIDDLWKLALESQQPRRQARKAS
jgi:hypothetical protein